jgi:hypothetical protein
MKTRVETTMPTLTTVKRMLAGAMVLMAVLAAPKAGHADVPYQQTAYSYQDSDGPGQLIIRDAGPDAATGGRKIVARLTQYGSVAEGSGFQTASANGGSLLVFTLRDAYGYSYVFRGQVGNTTGSGLYERAGTGYDLSAWQIHRLPIYY